MSEQSVEPVEQGIKRVDDPEKRQMLNNSAEQAALARALHINRTVRGLSTEQLAEKAGVAHSAILAIENGTFMGRLRTLVKIANVLDIAIVVQFVPFSEFVVTSGEPSDD